MSLDNHWATEIHADHGTAFSLKIKRQLHEETTPFQTISIVETETFGNLMLIDGFIMLSSRENFFYHEMMAHPVLFTHPKPKVIAIIGGGDCGSLQAVLQHDSVTEAIQIEIDERVTRLSEQYFPELCANNNDPRASLLFIDGIEWMKSRAAHSIDIIIIDSTDPIGPAEGLFSSPFYASCFNALKQDGLLIQQSESPLYHLQLIKDMRSEMHTAGFNSLQTLCFPQCVYPSGWWSATMAGKGTALNQFREDAAANKKFKTQYYNPEIHKAALAIPEFMK